VIVPPLAPQFFPEILHKRFLVEEFTSYSFKPTMKQI
jgi:hypothetical protein